MNFLSIIKQKAKKLQKKILFPESFDDRVLRAVELILREKTAKPVLLGKTAIIKQRAKKLRLKINWAGVEFIDMEAPAYRKRYAGELYQLREEKGLTLSEARKLIKDYNYFGVMAVQQNDADGMISGSVSTTASMVRPVLQIIKPKEKFHKVSAVFFMLLDNRLLLFADCAINIEPNSYELAGIALDTALTAERFGIKPRIAMLSFSTCGSGKHPLVDKVREATQIVADRRPDLIVEGEMQVDAALVPEVAARKCPNARIKGDANVLIFPDLQSGNISYKLVEQLAGAKAIGPLLQGLQKPINDLSRGCSYHDIANLAALTACEAEELEHDFGSKPVRTIGKNHL